MVLGEKLWEGNAKSAGPGFIKSIDMEGVTSMYSWLAQLTGMGRAQGTDANVNITGFSMTPPKGVSKAKDQGVFMTTTGDMAALKGFDLMKMTMGTNPSAVGLWSFMTMSEKLSWMNDLIALVVLEAKDLMWNESHITIYEWK